MKKILLLGSGELGKEFVIAAKRAGVYVVACDRYAGAPAMQVADECEGVPMLDGEQRNWDCARQSISMPRRWRSFARQQRRLDSHAW